MRNHWHGDRQMGSSNLLPRIFQNSPSSFKCPLPRLFCVTNHLPCQVNRCPQYTVHFAITYTLGRLFSVYSAFPHIKHQIQGPIILFSKTAFFSANPQGRFPTTAAATYLMRALDSSLPSVRSERQWAWLMRDSLEYSSSLGSREYRSSISFRLPTFFSSWDSNASSLDCEKHSTWHFS